MSETNAKALTDTEAIVSWRRTLFGPRLAEWNKLSSRIANIQLSHECVLKNYYCFLSICLTLQPRDDNAYSEIPDEFYPI
jgi:hypothetical protein